MLTLTLLVISKTRIIINAQKGGYLYVMKYYSAARRKV